jgi:hypothetical protein
MDMVLTCLQFLIMQGERPDGDNEGLQGLKSLGVRELHYRLAFLACSIQQTNPQVILRQKRLFIFWDRSLVWNISNVSKYLHA